jgi:hypothetical protein
MCHISANAFTCAQLTAKDVEADVYAEAEM